MTTLINPNQIDGQLGANTVVTVSTTNLPLATAYENGDTVNGVVLSTGDLILLTGQVPSSDNGYYQVNASGAPTKLPSNGSNLYYVSGGTFAGQTFVDTSGGAGTGFSVQSGGNVSGNEIVKTVSLTNLPLATGYENGDTVNGYTLVTGDYILVSGQTTASENGFYQVNATGAPTLIGENIGTSFFITSGNSANSTYIHSGVNTYTLQSAPAGSGNNTISGSFTAGGNFPANTAVQFGQFLDNGGLKLDSQTANDTFTGAVTVNGANPNRAIVAVVQSQNNAATGAFVTSATCNGSPMTLVGSKVTANNGFGASVAIGVFVFPNPTAGLNTVVATAGGNNQAQIQVFSVYNFSSVGNVAVTANAPASQVATITYNAGSALLGTLTLLGQFGPPSVTGLSGGFTNVALANSTFGGTVISNTSTVAGGPTAITINQSNTGGSSNNLMQGLIVELRSTAVVANGVIQTNATTSPLFAGFTTAASTQGSPVTVAFSGLLSGFVGLVQNSTYYITNVAGAIGTSPGTNSKKVGIAASSTQLLIINDNN